MKSLSLLVCIKLLMLTYPPDQRFYLNVHFKSSLNLLLKTLATKGFFKINVCEVYKFINIFLVFCGFSQEGKQIHSPVLV